MDYISSDTNVWLDFVTIDQINLPFLLPYTYLMNSDAMEDEFLNPPGLSETLLKLGLKATELTEEEFYLTEEYIGKYKRPSLYDCIALAIAKVRGIILLTGDRALRKAAMQEGVQVMGTIGVLEQLHQNGYVSLELYKECLEKLQEYNGGKVRLPEKELQRRIDELR